MDKPTINKLGLPTQDYARRERDLKIAVKTAKSPEKRERAEAKLAELRAQHESERQQRRERLLAKQPRVVVKTVKGDAAAEREIRQMLALGYELDQQSSRKVLWSPATGVFTRKQKHTLTFIKQ